MFRSLRCTADEVASNCRPVLRRRPASHRTGRLPPVSARSERAGLAGSAILARRRPGIRVAVRSGTGGRVPTGRRGCARVAPVFCGGLIRAFLTRFHRVRLPRPSVPKRVHRYRDLRRPWLLLAPQQARRVVAALPPTVVVHPEHTPPGRRPYPLHLAGQGGTGPAIMTGDLVACNGATTYDGGPLVIARRYRVTPRQCPDEHGRYFTCCKIGALPYDLPVTAALIRLQRWFPADVEVSSDGGPPGWADGQALCASLFGEAELPPSVAGRPW
jgi:hypothetical protein